MCNFTTDMEKTTTNDVVIAMDSYKGCLNQRQANLAVAKGVAAAGLSPDVVEVSDGGEGWTDAFATNLGIEPVEIYAHDALMRPIKAHYIIDGATAIIEVAQTVALSMIEPEQLNPLKATSYGVGEMVADAIKRGCRRFLVGLGGTATSDAGIGMLQAMTDKLAHGKHFDDIAGLYQLQFTIGTDVRNPLLGPDGAAAVFAPQKGATPEMVALLERRGATLAKAAARHYGHDESKRPGAGAAGGLGYAFMQFLGAKRLSGAEIMLSECGFDSKLSNARLVITGEGSSDEQTLMGKLPAVVLGHCLRLNVPALLLSGQVKGCDKLLQAGFAEAVAVSEGLALAEAMKPETAITNLELKTRQLVQAFSTQS